MRIKDVMEVDVEAVASEASLDEAAFIMRSAGVGSLPVLDEERLVGVISARDIVERAVAAGLDLSATAVRDIMTAGVLSCGESGDPAEAASLMERHRLRRVYVVDDNGDLSGMLARAVLASLETPPPADPVPERAASGRSCPAEPGVGN